MWWLKPCSFLTQSRIRISAEKWKPKDWAWLIFHTQLVHSWAVPDSSFYTRVQMGSMALVFANPLFSFFFFFWLLKDKRWHFPQRKKIPCSTKERIKGALRNDLGSPTSPHSRGKPALHLPAADKNRRRPPIYSWFAHASPLSSDLNFPCKINLIQLVACWHC